MRRWSIWQFFPMIFCNWLIAAQTAPPLGDRLVLEINHSAFTQRQMEVHIALKQILKPQQGKSGVVNGQNWHDWLNIYCEDMLIYQEVRRQGHFQPNKDQLQRAIAQVHEALKTQATFRTLAQRLGIDERTLARTSSDILQIEEYRRIKDKSVEKSWLKKLERRFVVRFYKGTEQYRLIQPELGNRAQGT